MCVCERVGVRISDGELRARGVRASWPPLASRCSRFSLPGGDSARAPISARNSSQKPDVQLPRCRCRCRCRLRLRKRSRRCRTHCSNLLVRIHTTHSTRAPFRNTEGGTSVQVPLLQEIPSFRHNPSGSSELNVQRLLSPRDAPKAVCAANTGCRCACL